MILVDQRRPLDLAKKGREYLDTLLAAKQCGKYEKVELSLGEIAELYALQKKVVSDVRTGDLELDLPDGSTRRLREEDVLASHVRKKRLAVNSLLQRIFAGREPATPPVAREEEMAVGPFDEDDLRRFIRAQLA